MASASSSTADAFVFFGASGDLVYKKIFPALQALVRRGRMDAPVIGVGRTEWTDAQFIARAKDSLKNHGGLDKDAFAQLSSRLRFLSGDYSDPTMYQRLCALLAGARRPLHYLAIPPSLFPKVLDGLAASGCAQDARVVLEKPFGRDLASARALNQLLHRHFPEEAIFRIDHYLGKEAVQNLTYFRFANPVVEASWNRDYIDSVQITMAERFGVEGRGKFYEESGAIRDVVQNHLLQVIACLAMDCPKGNDPACLRAERGRLLQTICPLDPAETARGQFRGYREEEGVAKDSQVETFAALRFHIDNPRWQGVPFYVRTGKRLPVTATEALVRFKPQVRSILEDTDAPPSNYYRFRLGPEVKLALGIMVKKAGETMVGEPIELDACHMSAGDLGPYERLLGDAAQGDATLFAREDEVEACWRVVDPILGTVVPVQEYDPQTWGPAEVNDATTPPGDWHKPKGVEPCG